MERAWIVANGLPGEPPEQVRALVNGLIVEEDQLSIELDMPAVMAAPQHPAELDDAPHFNWIIRIPFALAPARRHRKAVITDAARRSQPIIDPLMINAVLRARRWFDMLMGGQVGSISDLAAVENVNRAWISAQLPLAFLAPDIAVSILDGCQPAALILKDLNAIASASVDWAEQRQDLMAIVAS